MLRGTGITEDGTATIIATTASPSGMPSIAKMNDGAEAAADEQQWEDRPADEAERECTGGGEDLDQGAHQDEALRRARPDHW